MSEKLTQEEFDKFSGNGNIITQEERDKAIRILRANTNFTSSPPSELDSLVSELRDKWGLDIVVEKASNGYIFDFDDHHIPQIKHMDIVNWLDIIGSAVRLALESYAEKQKTILYGFKKYRLRDKMFSANHDVASNRVIITDSNGHTETLTVEEFRKKYEAVE